ncbi:MAG: ComEC/Rec2 family competence protein, partial [Desulfobacula sp.]|nr:ComEC/Rec2 family competence protein [Desulfobacula sp.]
MKTFFKPLNPASFFIFITLMAGILAGSISPDDKTFVFPAVFCLSVLICLSLYSYKKFAFLFFLGLVFCCGYLSIQIKLTSDLPSHHISNYLDTKKIKITGRVVSFKKHYKKKYSMIVLPQTIETKDNIKKKDTGRIILNIYGLSETIPEFGDYILFESSIKSIRNFMNPGAFDYKSFLKLKGIYGTAYSYPGKIKILTQTDEINFFLKLIRKIENLRTGYYDFILTHAKDLETSKIIVSLITGKKEVISQDMRDLLSKAGISHLLAISGFHLSIVSLFFFLLFYQVLSFFPRLAISGKSKKIAGILSLFPLIGYAIFSGFSPSTQRALIMIIVLLFSFVSEKEKDIVSSLSIAGILILALDSAALFSISFQLSFMAVVFIAGGIFLLKRHFLIQKKNI